MQQKCGFSEAFGLSVGFGLELVGNLCLLKALLGVRNLPCYGDCQDSCANSKVPVFVRSQAGLAAWHLSGPPQIKITSGCGGVMPGFFSEMEQEDCQVLQEGEEGTGTLESSTLTTGLGRWF